MGGVSPTWLVSSRADENSSCTVFFFDTRGSFLVLALLRRNYAPLRFLPVPKICTELITNNAAAALAVPIALSIAKELEVNET